MNQLEKQTFNRHKRAVNKGLGDFYDAIARDKAKQVKIRDEEMGQGDDGDYNSQNWLKGRTPDADRALLEAIQAGKVGACELFYKITERLRDKQEVSVEYRISAEDREKIAKRTAEILRGFSGRGSAEDCLPAEPPLLPENIRQDTG